MHRSMRSLPLAAALFATEGAVRLYPDARLPDASTLHIRSLLRAGCGSLPACIVGAPSPRGCHAAPWTGEHVPAWGAATPPRLAAPGHERPREEPG
jgi:hypothetical protein